eukprot:GHVS01073992.1.p1 GENE.GHVS01073992.1~~GHVS01073992.1.p1  ORF type:complete len:828 (+),score=117.62 GHVS01073992.1:155-2638(+)
MAVNVVVRGQDQRYTDSHAVSDFGEVLRTYAFEAEGVAGLLLPYVEEALELITLGNQATFEVDFDHLSPSARTHIIRHFDRVYSDLVDELNGFIREVDIQNNHPPTEHLLSHFLKFVHGPVSTFNIRSIRAEYIGQFIAVKGQVTRTSEVHPEVVLASFTCRLCNSSIANVEQEHKLSLPIRCSNDHCMSKFDFELLPEECKFGAFQKIRIQEASHEAGDGSIPRAMEIVLRNHEVDQVYAGDEVIITGCLIAAPMMPALLKKKDVPKGMMRLLRPNEGQIAQGVTGMKFVGVREMNHRMMFLANSVQRVTTGASIDTITQHSDDSEVPRPADVFQKFPWIKEITDRPDTLDQLAKLVAPRVYGAKEIKLGILLMLAGGIQKISENFKLRGDINICIVGDPSTGKSQLLKFVEGFSDRAIFTSGKGSTAAGLTAAVHRDPESGETVLEAGALMYADQGVCCIDEFDKMNEKDRVSIHEAMEQQTISISKAGIQATLNARACILAGCNPRFGRYDKSKTFSQNVNIPSPLLSRFDLFFTTTDELDVAKDKHVSEHLIDVIMNASKDEEQDDDTIMSVEDLKLYVGLAKHMKPCLTADAKRKLVDFYMTLRSDEMLSSARSMRITVRQLEALIRLSEAVAKLNFAERVTDQHVEVACSIFSASLRKVTNVASAEVAAAATVNEGAEGTPNEQKHIDELGITYEEYNRISDRLLKRVKEHEAESGVLVRQQELLEWYLNTFVDTKSHSLAEQLREWWPKLLEIVRRMVHTDAVLMSKESPDADDDSLYLGASAQPVPEQEEQQEEQMDAEGEAAEDLDDIDFMDFEDLTI